MWVTLAGRREVDGAIMVALDPLDTLPPGAEDWDPEARFAPEDPA